ncbi:MAG: A/G-specific adenine glycosylase [Pseudomonadota bacterium]
MMAKESHIAEDLNALPDLLLDWYDEAARDLPWRVGPKARAEGERPDPYRVWLAEIMLQQTTIPHGTRYFHEFTRRWPTVDALAEARDEDVMAAWAGLGYYARARNLLKCAREVSSRGGFPQTAQELIKLPGIGPYTAGAIAALAFGERAAAVDGNVERVFSRLLAIEKPLKDAKSDIKQAVLELVPGDRPAEFAEGLMDLGATVCTPKRPNCLICSVSELCAARRAGEQERFPIKLKKAPKPHRTGHVFIALSKGELLLERRPEKGLLGGMLGLPGSQWGDVAADEISGAPAQADWQHRGEVRHVFTHFSLTLQVWQGSLKGKRPSGVWNPVDQVEGLPSVFAKVFKLLERA